MFGYGDEDKPEIDWETVKQVKENTQNHFKEILRFERSKKYIFPFSSYRTLDLVL